jgi:hypothetical protein
MHRQTLYKSLYSSINKKLFFDLCIFALAVPLKTRHKQNSANLGECMCNIPLERAISIARDFRLASNTELQKAHQTLKVRCNEVANGVNYHLLPIILVSTTLANELKQVGVRTPLASLKKWRLTLADELGRRAMPHKATRPERQEAA